MITAKFVSNTALLVGRGRKHQQMEASAAPGRVAEDLAVVFTTFFATINIR